MNSNFKKKARESWDGSGKTSRMSGVGYWLEMNDCLISQGRAHYALCTMPCSCIRNQDIHVLAPGFLQGWAGDSTRLTASESGTSLDIFATGVRVGRSSGGTCGEPGVKP